MGFRLFGDLPFLYIEYFFKILKNRILPLSLDLFPSGFRLIERLHHGGSSLREVVAALEADMEAMYDMIDRFGGGSSASGSSRNRDNQVKEQF